MYKRLVFKKLVYKGSSADLQIEVEDKVRFGNKPSGWKQARWTFSMAQVEGVHKSLRHLLIAYC